MNRRERLHACYFHEPMDRPAVYTRTFYPADDPTYDRLKAYMAEKSDLKGGWSVTLSPRKTSASTEPHSEDFERIVTVLHTPRGDLTASHLRSLKGQPGLHEQYFIKDRKDAETFLSLPPREVDSDAEAFHTAVREMGDAGIVEACFGGMNPAGTVAELCGSENFAMMSVTDRDILEALLDRICQERLRAVDWMLDHEIGPYFDTVGEEYVVPPLHGPADFRDFNIRYDKPWSRRIHEAGGRLHVHSHGPLRSVLEGFVELGADVLHPVEPPPMGDVTAKEAKEILRGKVTIEGNIQIADMYETTPEAIRQQTEALIADAFDDRRGLIVSPSASPYLRGLGEEAFARYEAMVETVIRQAE